MEPKKLSEEELNDIIEKSIDILDNEHFWENVNQNDDEECSWWKNVFPHDD